jgi:hypothetical protein
MEYIETFDKGSGGWWGFIDNFHDNKPLEIEQGAALSYSPWWVDYNHAPPCGGGYLHLLYGLFTKGPFGDRMREIAGTNRFVQGGYPTNFIDADITVRIKGELELRGAQLCLLVQGVVGGICSGWVLTGQPFEVTADWTEQTITAALDTDQWTCLKSRHDRTETYGEIPLETILSDVNTNIYFVLFPLTVVPMGPVNGDPQLLRAGRDYRLWQSRLPEGYVMLDTVKIKFP